MYDLLITIYGQDSYKQNIPIRDIESEGIILLVMKSLEYDIIIFFFSYILLFSLHKIVFIKSAFLLAKITAKDETNNVWYMSLSI